MSRKKGNKREREAREFYEDAGYTTERSQGTRWDRSDWWGHFDLMAMSPDELRFAQVKSQEASGIYDIIGWARQWGAPNVKFDMLVCHDREGWRLLRLLPEDETYTCVVDERDTDGNMGDGVVAYLAD